MGLRRSRYGTEMIAVGLADFSARSHNRKCIRSKKDTRRARYCLVNDGRQPVSFTLARQVTTVMRGGKRVRTRTDPKLVRL